MRKIIAQQNLILNICRIAKHYGWRQIHRPLDQILSGRMLTFVKHNLRMTYYVETKNLDMKVTHSWPLFQYEQVNMFGLDSSREFHAYLKYYESCYKMEYKDLYTLRLPPSERAFGFLEEGLRLGWEPTDNDSDYHHVTEMKHKSWVFNYNGKTKTFMLYYSNPLPLRQKYENIKVFNMTNFKHLESYLCELPEPVKVTQDG